MESLENHFLIAMPTLSDSFFKRTVTYICEHNADGAMGLIINQPVEITTGELLGKLNVDYNHSHPNATLPVYNGGPVQTDRGFVLHTPQPEKNWPSSLQLSDDLALTTSRDILGALTTEEAPEKFMIVLGYSGWSAGQLEQELSENSWLTIPADSQLLFDIPVQLRWETAAQRLGINMWQMSGQVGHA